MWQQLQACLRRELLEELPQRHDGLLRLRLHRGLTRGGRSCGTGGLSRSHSGGKL